MTEKEAIYIIHAQNMTYKKVGKKFGVTYRAIEKLLENARARLRCKNKKEMFKRIFGENSRLLDKDALLKNFQSVAKRSNKKD